ncbi:MAG: hypothetical protein ACR2NN_03385 [Bryobacteraceae bacterium]
MSSPRRIAASRANGALSSGPKTPETRQVSAQNALCHGLTAETVVLGTESQERFQQLLDSYLLRFQPRDRVEADLVEEMVVAKWRQRRLWSIESASLDFEMDRQDARLRADSVETGHSALQAIAFKSLADKSNSLDLLNRYETRLRHACERAMIGFQFLHSQPNEPSPTIEQHLEGTPVQISTAA